MNATIYENKKAFCRYQRGMTASKVDIFWNEMTVTELWDDVWDVLAPHLKTEKKQESLHHVIKVIVGLVVEDVP